MKKRIINFRLLFFIAIPLALGIIFVSDIFDGKLIVILPLLGALMLCFILAITKKKFVILIICFCSFIVGCGLYYAGLDFATGDDMSESEVSVECYLSDELKSETSYSLFLAGDVVIDGQKRGNNMIVCVYSFSGERSRVGEKISFVSVVSEAQLVCMENVNTYYTSKNAYYYASANYFNVQTLDYQETLRYKFSSNIKTLFNRNMSSDCADLSYSVLFGDKSDFNDNLSDAYYGLGLGHLLAVSGLHIGFLVMLLSYLLSKLRLGAWLQLVIFFAMLMFYCYLCNWTSSVVRASVMSLCYLLAKASGKQSDMLSSMSLAMLLLLLIRPLSVFESGFQFTFVCVFSIICLTPILEKLFAKIKFKGKIASLLAVTISIQIGIMPLIANMGKDFSVLTIIINLICVPIFQVGFMLLIIVLPLALIGGSLAKILILPEYVFYFLNSIVLSAFSNNLTLELANLGRYFVVGYEACIFVASRFLMLNIKTKMATIAIVATLTGLITIADYYENNFDKNSIACVEGNGYEFYMINSEGNINLIFFGDDIKSFGSMLNTFCKNRRINKINNIIAIQSKVEEQNSKVNSIMQKYDVENYQVFNYGDEYAEKFISSNTVYCGGKFVVGNKVVTIVKSNCQIYDDSDIIFSCGKVYANCKYNYLLSDNNDSTYCLYGKYMFTFEVKNDKIKLVRSY